MKTFYWVTGILCVFTGVVLALVLSQLDTSVSLKYLREDGPSIQERVYWIGLWISLRGNFEMPIDLGWIRSLWAVPYLGRWSWII